MNDDPWILVVGTAPADPDSREMLELVLAGATLDCRLVVVFRSAGAAHLEPGHFDSWRQLIDFSLAELFVDSADAPALPPGGVGTMSEESFERLSRSAAGVFEL
ncbi:MAG: hypothetical protein GVY32_02005 [Gammaproteobacteria bacterium]|jgi:predicted Rossmann-fold nucleotide-binding protein|nr:hypothetical protein [Gammaproteobacteria bacterium]